MRDNNDYGLVSVIVIRKIGMFFFSAPSDKLAIFFPVKLQFGYYSELIIKTVS